MAETRLTSLFPNPCQRFVRRVWLCGKILKNTMWRQFIQILHIILYKATIFYVGRGSTEFIKMSITHLEFNRSYLTVLCLHSNECFTAPLQPESSISEPCQITNYSQGTVPPNNHIKKCTKQKIRRVALTLLLFNDENKFESVDLQSDQPKIINPCSVHITGLRRRKRTISVYKVQIKFSPPEDRDREMGKNRGRETCM